MKKTSKIADSHSQFRHFTAEVTPSYQNKVVWQAVPKVKWILSPFNTKLWVSFVYDLQGVPWSHRPSSQQNANFQMTRMDLIYKGKYWMLNSKTCLIYQFKIGTCALTIAHPSFAPLKNKLPFFWCVWDISGGDFLVQRTVWGGFSFFPPFGQQLRNSIALI